MSSKLKALKGVTLNVANKVYLQDGDYDLQSQIKDDAVKVFDAAMEKVDFGKNVAAVNTINGWVIQICFNHILHADPKLYT